MSTHVCTRCSATYDDAQWEALPGASRGREAELLPGLVLEYRNCPCNGTMAADPVPPVLSLLNVRD